MNKYYLDITYHAADDFKELAKSCNINNIIWKSSYYEVYNGWECFVIVIYCPDFDKEYDVYFKIDSLIDHRCCSELDKLPGIKEVNDTVKKARLRIQAGLLAVSKRLALWTRQKLNLNGTCFFVDDEGDVILGVR